MGKRKPIPVDEMKNVVECPECHKPEYYGMIHWREGHRYCRSCIYEIWERFGRWSRNSDKDFEFPTYEDGVDYTEKEVEENE